MDIWVGTFKTTTYNASFVTGIITLPLPKNLTNVADNIETIVSMNYKGLYKHGSSQTFPIKYSPENLENTRIDDETKKLKFTGNTGRQIINITIDDIYDQQIKGTYVTYNPFDTGTFNINKGSGTNFEQYTTNSVYPDFCTIS